MCQRMGVAPSFFITSDLHRHFGAPSAISLHRDGASTHALFLHGVLQSVVRCGIMYHTALYLYSSVFS